jgi:hypothetical protein
MQGYEGASPVTAAPLPFAVGGVWCIGRILPVVDFPAPDRMEGPHVIPPPYRYLAAVCRNGHIITDTLAPPRQPTGMGVAEVGSPRTPPPTVPGFCGQCGVAVLRACRSCEAPILGAHEMHIGSEPLKQPASFCWACGESYAWATREQRVGKLYDQIDHEDLDEATWLTVCEQIAVLATPVDEKTDEDRVRAGERFRRVAPKAWETALPVLQTLLTAEVKKRLGLP